MCRFFEPFIIGIYWGLHRAIFGCTVLWKVHPASAQNKSLISDTDTIYFLKADFMGYLMVKKI